MKKSKTIKLIPEQINEYYIEGSFIDNKHADLYGLYWKIDNISCYQESDNEHEIVIALDCTPFNIYDWKQLENINLKGEENVNLHFSNGSGDFDWVEKPKLKISERIKDTFRVQISGIIGSIDLINNDGDFFETINDIKFSIDKRLRFNGIILGNEYLKNNKKPEKIINISNLKMEKVNYGFIFKPIIND